MMHELRNSKNGGATFIRYRNDSFIVIIRKNGGYVHLSEC